MVNVIQLVQESDRNSQASNEKERKTGKKVLNLNLILRKVREFPGETARDIATMLQREGAPTVTDLNTLWSMGKVRRGESKRSAATKRLGATWWPTGSKRENLAARLTYHLFMGELAEKREVSAKNAADYHEDQARTLTWAQD